jgi:hypothetical protein
MVVLRPEWSCTDSERSFSGLSWQIFKNCLQIKKGEHWKLIYAVIWKEQVALVVGAASSRDHFVSRLEAAPAGWREGWYRF